VALVAGGAVLVTVFLIWLLSTVEIERQRKLLKNVNETISLRLNAELTDIVSEIKRHECIIQSQLSVPQSNYYSWMSANISSQHDTDSYKLNSYFNSPVSLHHTGALHLIDDTLVWANWSKGGRLYPDVIFNESAYPSLGFSDPKYLFTLHGTSLTEQFGFQVINAWSSQRNSILVSIRPEKKTQDLVNAFSKKITQGVTEIKAKLEASKKANGKKVPFKIPPIVNLDVLALETKLFSVTETALPAEIQYAVLDPEGNVLFHSDSKRNLRENFIEECNQQNLVRMAIQSRMDTTLTVIYFGKYQEANFSAVEGMPFTVVTLYDSTAYLDSLMNGATFTLTMLLMLTLVVALIFLMSLILTRRPSLLRRQTVNLKWIRLTALNLQVCKRLLSVLFIILVLSWLLSYAITASLFLAFSIPIMTIALTGGIIYAFNEDRYEAGLYTRTIAYQFRTFFSLCGIAQFVNFLVALAGPSVDRWQVYSLGSVTLGMLALLVLQPGLLRHPGADVQLIIRAFLNWRRPFNRTLKIGRRFRLFSRIRVTPGTSFTGINNMLVPNKGRYIVTAIILLVVDVSVVPTAMFFSNAANQEVQVVEKRNAMELARNIEDRQVWLMTNFPESANDFDKISDTTLLGGGIYTMENEIGDYILLDKAELRAEIDKGRQRDRSAERRSELIREMYARIINAPNFDWDRREAMDMFTHRNFSDDPTHFWWWNATKDKRRLIYHYPSYYPSQSHSGVLIELDMFKSPYDVVSAADWTMFGIVAFALIYLIYKVLFFTYKKVTLLEYFNCTTTNQIRDADRNFIDNIFNSMDNTNLIVIALPGTDVEYMILNKLQGYVLDERCLLTKNILHRIYIPSNQRSGIEIVMLPFFDLSGLENLATALNDFSILLEDPTRKIIWITSVDPCEQVAALGKRMIAAAKQTGGTGDATADKFRVERENLLRILDDFKKINYRLEKNIPASYAAAISIAHVEEEFSYGAYFRRLREDVIRSGTLRGYYRSNAEGVIYQKIDERSDDLFVLKIQDMAQNYYYSIWSTLSSREKYVLFDIAHDELTNHKNYSILVELERKGILYFDSSENALKIFNKSFRNFILTVVNPEEALLLEREINTAGTWDVIRTLMIIFTIAAGTFLFVMEKWFYNQLLVVIGGVAVIAPAVISFFDTGLKQLWTRKSSTT
jgi:hypothetical protein